MIHLNNKRLKDDINISKKSKKPKESVKKVKKVLILNYAVILNGRQKFLMLLKVE